MSIFIPAHCSGDTCLACHEEDAHSFDRPQHNEGLGGAGDVLHNGN